MTVSSHAKISCLPPTPPYPTPTSKPLTPVSLALAVLISALWGGNAVATKFALHGLPALTAAGLRFALASLFMLVWCYVEGAGLKLRPRQVRPAVCLGVLMFLQIGSFNIGVRESNSSHAVLLVNTSVFWVLLIEHFVTRVHRLTPRKTLGVILAAAGTLLLVGTGATESGETLPDQPTFWGDVVLLISAVVLSLKIIYTREALKVVEPGKLIFWHDIVGTTLLLLCGMLWESVDVTHVNGTVILSLLYQGLVVGGFCFATHALLLRKHAASQIAIFSFAAPLFGVFLASVLRQDPLTPWLGVAAVCVAVGIVLVNWSTSQQSPRE